MSREALDLSRVRRIGRLRCMVHSSLRSVLTVTLEVLKRLWALANSNLRREVDYGDGQVQRYDVDAVGE